MPNTLQAYFRDRKGSLSQPAKKLSTPAHALTDVPTHTSTSVPNTIDVFQLPVAPDLQGLTKLQRLFSMATQIDIRSLTIVGNNEFFLFMEMCAERGWASFKMTPHKWVVETGDYNSRLKELNGKARQLFIAKNPQALVDKLAAIKISVMNHLATQNFKCELVRSQI